MILSVHSDTDDHIAQWIFVHAKDNWTMRAAYQIYRRDLCPLPYTYTFAWKHLLWCLESLEPDTQSIREIRWEMGRRLATTKEQQLCQQHSEM